MQISSGDEVALDRPTTRHGYLAGTHMRDVNAILDSNYLNRDQALAESAIFKLEKRTKTPN